MRRLKKACENTKIMLSVDYQTDIQLHSLAEGHNFQTQISRDELKELIASEILDKIKNAIEEIQGIDKVLLVGGSTQIPEVKNLFEDQFERVNVRCLGVDSFAKGAVMNISEPDYHELDNNV